MDANSYLTVKGIPIWRTKENIGSMFPPRRAEVVATLMTFLSYTSSVKLQ